MKIQLQEIIDVLGGEPDPRVEIWSLYWEARARLRLLALEAYHRAAAQAIEQGYELGDANDAFKHVAQDVDGPMSSFTQFLTTETLE